MSNHILDIVAILFSAVSVGFALAAIIDLRIVRNRLDREMKNE